MNRLWMGGSPNTSEETATDVYVATLPPSSAARWLALVVVALSALIFAAIIPFVRIPLPQLPAFIPAYQSALAINDLITAFLLYAQFKRLGSKALLALAAGYLFNTFIIVSHTLSFPGVLSATGLLGAGDQTTAWLYVFWHGAFPLFVLAYALLRGRGHLDKMRAERIVLAIIISALAVAAAVVALTFFSTAGMHFLPIIIKGNDFSLLVSKGVSPAILGFSFIALIALRRQKQTTMLDLWLMVVMCVWLFDVALSAVFGSSRYDLGWYAGRSYGLLAASFVLAVLLFETSGLHARLAATSRRLAVALESNRARYDQILDRAPMTVAVKDLAGRYIVVNRGLEQRSEKKRDFVLGKTIKEIFGDSEYTREHEALDREVLATRKTVQREFTRPHQDGPQTLLFAKFPLFDANQNVEAIGSIALDITEQKKADAALERLFQTSIDLILVVDAKGKLLRVNPSCATILGYEPSEMIGQSAIEFIFLDDLEKTRNEMRMARRGHQTRNFETRYNHKDGHVVTLSWTGVWSDQAQQHFFVGRDMTDRIKLEEALRQSQKMEAIGQLTGGIAHDYNNLLTVIIGNTELLAEGLRNQPEFYSSAKLALDAAERSATLTQRLLAFGRRQALESRVSDLNALLAEMMDLMQGALGGQVKIDLRPGPNLWSSNIDRGQFETAILNLSVNARDAMPSGGTVTIETANATLDENYVAINPSARLGEYVCVAVSDTGSGMSPDVLSRVFEPFFTTKEVGKGTGLGLSMIYGFVKQSGGHVTIYSEPGIGTVVRVYFPRADAPSIVPSISQGSQADLPMGNETILLVEDDPLVRSHTEKQLIALGYRVHVADKGSVALELIGTGFEPDLLLTDVVMPGGMNGRQLAEEIVKRLPKLKVLYTSGYTQGAILKDGGPGAEVNFLSKPFRRAELARKIRESLENKTTLAV